MPYCRECGSFIDEGATYCKTCGEDVIVLTREEYEELQEQSEDSEEQDVYSYGSNTVTLEPQPLIRRLHKRNFWVMFPFFITWFFLVVYLLTNSQDLENLSKHSLPPEVPNPRLPDLISFLTGVSYILFPLAIIIRPIFYYYKFQRLHDYLEFHPEKQETIPINGTIACIYNTLFFLFTITGSILLAIFSLGTVGGIIGLITLIVGLIFCALLSIASNTWQKALNERIDILYSDENIG